MNFGIKNVSRTIGGKSIVNNVSITVRPGEVVGLMGPNGAGKTSTFNLAVGNLKPDKGDILMNDKDVNKAVKFLKGCLQDIIDEKYGNNDGITLENETENYEVTVRQEVIGTEGNHYLNGVVAIIDQYAFEMSFSHGNCSEVDLLNISIEGKFSFDVNTSDEYVLLFNTTEDPRVNNLQVNYCIFEDFEVQSVSGLANESIDEECVSGFRIAGEYTEIKFQDPQSSAIPSISYMSTILVILLSLAIFDKRID